MHIVVTWKGTFGYRVCIAILTTIWVFVYCTTSIEPFFKCLSPPWFVFGYILLVHQIGDSTWSLNKTKLWGWMMKLSLLLAASQRKVQAEIEYKCAKQSLWIWITQQSFLPHHIFNITGDWLGLLHFKIASYFQFLHAGVKGITALQSLGFWRCQFWFGQ